jgi:hypothetical protein
VKHVGERIREALTALPALDYFAARIQQGWKLVAVEWERETTAEVRASQAPRQEVPYGFQIAGDCLHLQESPDETRVLMLILEEVVRDRRFSQIADELNRNGMRTRNGSKWTSAAVFDLLPRLIEAGPQLLKSNDWREKRPHIVRRAETGTD